MKMVGQEMESDEQDPTDGTLLLFLIDAEKNREWIDEQRSQLAKEYANRYILVRDCEVVAVEKILEPCCVISK